MSAARAGNRGLWVVIGVLALTAALAIGGAVWFAHNGPKPPAPKPATVGVQQSLAVAAFIKAYVKDDPAAMEKLVTRRNRPWAAPPPTLPPGVSTDTVASFIEPFREGEDVVIGNPLVLEVRMTGDGKEPTGTVTARIAVRKQGTRTAKIGLVLQDGKWLVDSIDGAAAATKVHSLSQ